MRIASDGTCYYCGKAYATLLDALRAVWAQKEVKQ